ncbi:sigma-54-dependent Fis family transcriptional regulator [Vibrio mangrovi]|uniref:Acetoin catabolism regulatory protein n=1 Tax=Vibrio mangrovi TaxID=474394 RepID=A0A1Y6IWQ9_9VIBR|nr:sigma-54-dependent Fis family transcriptional regulator [Vibrio mangrovi]MDW6004632.1 sigma-54-dependent Fis family transcriptional regulator [Vibrio mangrovi]SMS00922.1 Acetoin catabolism regulatory protein [Vibrio mangrovi]
MQHVQFPAGDWLTSSWDRCSQAGLKQRRLPEHFMMSRAELKERKWSVNPLIQAVETYAVPLFNQMFAHSDSRLILTDKDGVILASWGQPRFKERLTQIALDNGACWQETLKGTNAIGTAIIESRPLTIIGKQHYIHQHQFISCSASPVFSHHGELIGILDITSEQQQHDLSTQILVQNMVQLVENHLLCDIPDSAVKINLACEKDLLNSGWQGVLVADESGKILAHNHIAFQLLERPSIIGLSVDHLLQEQNRELVFEKHTLLPARKKSSAFSASCELHFGDHRIEQAWQQANKLIDKDIPLLILGETGVGKNEFVKALHQHSSRKHRPLVIVNCGAIPKELLESELFGYVAGAFTGASPKGYQGKIRQANQGILFLDEIADMPLDAQCRLLHVLQEKEVIPVGSNQTERVDIQVIAATHKNLTAEVESGRFRQDLYYRLNGLLIELPALRERLDKARLIEHIHHKYRLSQQQICPQLLSVLQSYTWPGNIRELDNMLKVASLLASDEPRLKLAHIPGHVVKSLMAQSPPLENDHRQPVENSGREEQHVPDLKTTVESRLLQTYQATQGNISQTSRLLGISRNTIYRKLKMLGILNR